AAHTQTAFAPAAWQFPFGVSTEANGNIMVVDEGYAGIYRIDPNGNFLAPTPLSSGGLLTSPTNIAVVKAPATGTAPSVPTLTVTPAPISEGGTTTLNGQFTDPDTETHTVTISWGDGSTNTVVNVPSGTGTQTFSSTHTYKDNPASGPFSIAATVADAS